jgi:16S rRNA (cytosine967-C5)-methyltransferase
VFVSDVWNKSARKATDEGVVNVRLPYENGRILAFAVLQEFDRSERFIQDIMADLDSRHSLSSADRSLALDVAAGVVRRGRTLDVVIQSRITRPRHKVEPDLWRVLRIGAYQLLFSRTPDHAAVDSTVGLCRLIDRPRWTGFVNGVLRGIGRLLSDEPATEPSPFALPTSAGQWRSLNEAILPDPRFERADYFADAFSLPQALAERWTSRLTEPELIAACFHSIDPPETTLRINSVRANRDTVLQSLIDAGCKASAGRIDGSIHLEQSPRLEMLPGYAEGLWCVQDEAAMSASMLLAPQAGETILDLCAAPGGKTTHLAELSGDKATIVACDVANGRLQRIRDNAARLQLTSIQPMVIPKDGRDLPVGPFDAVLVDVPCSNTGVLNRRPEARWRFDMNGLNELVVLQTRLLLQACELVRPGGRVVYSTCSMEPEENRGVVDAVLLARKDFRLERENQHRPGLPADGAYQALLIRS